MMFAFPTNYLGCKLMNLKRIWMRPMGFYVLSLHGGCHFMLKIVVRSLNREHACKGS